MNLQNLRIETKGLSLKLTQLPEYDSFALQHVMNANAVDENGEEYIVTWIGKERKDLHTDMGEEEKATYDWKNPDNVFSVKTREFI